VEGKFCEVLMCGGVESLLSASKALATARYAIKGMLQALYPFILLLVD
jgi:hypothetical protein